MSCGKSENDTNYRPYCNKCCSRLRMAKTEYGFRCRDCQHEVGTDLKPLKEPFNIKCSCGRQTKKPTV